MIDLAIRPHPKAPLFSLEKDPKQVLKQIAEEVATGNFPANRAFLDLIRQAGFVSLFFFLRYIASANGPYQLLNEDLHLDMCNFRQSDYCMRPGARSACFTPRGFYKSSACGHGAVTWVTLRDPDARVRIVSNIVSRAYDFKDLTQRFYDSNPFAPELYGEYVPSKSAPRWNAEEFVLPNRTRYYVEPTVSAGGATGASEGLHVTDLVLDDIEGLDDIDSEHKSNMNMFQKKKWFNTNTTALLESVDSRIHINGTFYGSDDVHSLVMGDARSIHGYIDPEFETKPEGTWAIYYRSWKEGEKVVFSKVMNEEKYSKLLQDDPWSAITQYSNKPRAPALSEFYSYGTKRCRIVWSGRHKEWFVQKGGQALSDNWEDDVEETCIRAGSCDGLMTVDPAGTEKGMLARASRTAIGIGLMDSDENVYLIWSRTGFYSIFQVFDLIFEGCRKFEGIVRMVGVESNAMQKIIAPLLERERHLRDYYINPVPIPASGDKEGRIRTNVGRALMRGKVYLAVGEETYFEEERLIFPNNEYRRDTLDMFEKMLTAFHKPVSTEVMEEEEAAEEAYVYAYGRNRTTGY